MVLHGVVVIRRSATLREGLDVAFGVIHQDIFDSSLSLDYEARHLFQDMNVLGDENDDVMMDPVRLSLRLRMPLDLVKAKLEFLLAPDPHSKSSLEDGRRITEIKNDMGHVTGYHIVNRHYYKRLMSRTRRREYMRRYRSKKMEDRARP